jgi:hypothetical protein
MKRNIFIFVLSMLAFSAYAQVCEVSGPQSGEWDCDTILVIGDVEVPVGAELKVLPKTKVLFEGYYGITVKGSFEAVGTEEDSIYFTAADTVGIHLLNTGRGGWNAITFEKVVTPVNLEYCHFSYGKAAEKVTTGGALRFLYTDNITISHCKFTNNYTALRGAALYANHSNLFIEDCEVAYSYGNNAEIGTYMHGGGFFFLNCTVNMEDMYMHDNICPNCYGGAMSFDSCDVRLDRAVIEDNYSTNAGGIGIQRSSHRSVKISNVLLDHNFAEHYGGGMAISASSPEINNVSIINNFTGIAGGGGLQVYQESRPVFTNCIIWGNKWAADHHMEIGSQIWIWNEASRPSFKYSVLQYGMEMIQNKQYVKLYENMLEIYPEFADTLNRDYRLTSISPCVDAGTPELEGLFVNEYDLSGNQRVVNGNIDMGAYEFNDFSIDDMDAEKTFVSVYPNPLNENGTCCFDLKLVSNVTIKIYSILGVTVWEKNLGKLSAGKQFISLSDFAVQKAKKGQIYFLEIDTETEDGIVKLVF